MRRTSFATALLAGGALLTLSACGMFDRDDRPQSAQQQGTIQPQANAQPGTVQPMQMQGQQQGQAVNRPANLQMQGSAQPAPGQQGGFQGGAALGAGSGTSGTVGGTASGASGGTSLGAQGQLPQNQPRGTTGMQQGGVAGSGTTGAQQGNLGGAGLAGNTGMTGMQGGTTAGSGATNPQSGPQGGMMQPQGMATGQPQNSTLNNPQGMPQATGAPTPLSPQANLQQRNQLQNQMQQQNGLVAVNLNDVRLDIARNLNVDASKVPVTIQLPVSAAANVCGVDLNALAMQAQQSGGQTPSCNATNSQLAAQSLQTSIQ